MIQRLGTFDWKHSDRFIPAGVVRIFFSILVATTEILYDRLFFLAHRTYLRCVSTHSVLLERDKRRHIDVICGEVAPVEEYRHRSDRRQMLEDVTCAFECRGQIEQVIHPDHLCLWGAQMVDGGIFAVPVVHLVVTHFLFVADDCVANLCAMLLVICLSCGLRHCGTECFDPDDQDWLLGIDVCLVDGLLHQLE